MNPNAYQQMLMQQLLQSYQGVNQQPIKTEVVRVNGRNGAEAINLAPNSSIFLADNTKSDRIWLCMTDGAGYKTVQSFITAPEEQEDKQSVEARLTKLEEAVNELNTRNARRKQKSEECEGQQRLPGIDSGTDK